MTTARVETSVTVKNSPVHGYVHQDNHIPPTWHESSVQSINLLEIFARRYNRCFYGGWWGVGGGLEEVSLFPLYTNVSKISRIAFQFVRFLILRRSFYQCRWIFPYWSILRLGECQFRALNWHFIVSNEKEKLRYKASLPAHQESPRVCQESSWYRRTLSAGAVKPILEARRSKNKYTN